MAETGEPARRPDKSRTAPTIRATMPATGLRMIVCGLDTSMWKNPTSATRSCVKKVMLGTARAITPNTIRIMPIVRMVSLRF